MRLPYFSKHVQNGFGQRESPFLVSLANDAENHPLRVNRGDRQGNCLADSQSIGVDDREASPIDGLLQCSDQAAAVLIGANVRQPFLSGLAYFFLVNNAHSYPSVLT